MAIKLNDRYPGRANPASVDYPQGSFKNRTSPTAKDGTYLEQDWANDNQGFLQSILSYFGVTANGSVDKVGASQYFDALTSNPTELKKGMPKIATTAIAQALTNDTDMLTPKKLASVLGGSTLSGNGFASFPVVIAGVRRLIFLQWINTTVLGTQGALSNWPVAFPNECLFAGVFCQNGSSPVTVSKGTHTTTTIAAYASTTNVNIGFIGIGY